ncbi:MAG: repeat protein [Gemmatimonadetes bacterium]|nr:repeat protein [Gemmatimonadota bacterium]
MTRHHMLGALSAAAALMAMPLGAQCVPAMQRLITDREYDKARTALQAQIARTPSDDAAMHCMGRVLLAQDLSGDAVEWLDKATALNGKSAQHHLWLALALRAEGQRKGMLGGPALIGRMRTELETALTLDPALVDARYALLQFYAGAPAMMGGSMVKAREQAAEMSKVNPMRGHVGYAFVAEQEKDNAAAEKALLAAIAAAPDSDVTYSYAGAFYRRRERWTDVIAMYEKRLKIMPKDATPASVSNTHYSLGLAHEKLGHRDKAKSEYQLAIAANPANEDAKKALASMKTD